MKHASPFNSRKTGQLGTRLHLVHHHRVYHKGRNIPAVAKIVCNQCAQHGRMFLGMRAHKIRYHRAVNGIGARFNGLNKTAAAHHRMNTARLHTIFLQSPCDMSGAHILLSDNTAAGMQFIR